MKCFLPFFFINKLTDCNIDEIFSWRIIRQSIVREFIYEVILNENNIDIEFDICKRRHAAGVGGMFVYYKQKKMGINFFYEFFIAARDAYGFEYLIICFFFVKNDEKTWFGVEILNEDKLYFLKLSGFFETKFYTRYKPDEGLGCNLHSDVGFWKGSNIKFLEENIFFLLYLAEKGREDLKLKKFLSVWGNWSWRRYFWFYISEMEA